MVAAVVLAALCTSCKDEVACWEITLEQEMAGMKQSVSTYYWGTREEAEAFAKNGNASGSIMGQEYKAETTVKKASKAEADCSGSNVNMGGFDFDF